MKKILFCLMTVLCVMGVSAQSRSMSALIPTDYQKSVNLSIDNKSFTLVPQKVTIQEVDPGHIRIVVFHNHGQADFVFPASYDFTLEVVKTAWDLAYKWHYISEKEYQTGCQTYNRQKITK